MKRITGIILVITLLIAALGSVEIAKAENETIKITTYMIYFQSEGRKLLENINGMRTNEKEAWYWNQKNTGKIYCHDLKLLKYDYTLEKVAMQRAAELAISFSNSRPNGKSSFSLYTEMGLTYAVAGECLSAGYTEAQDVFEDLREDDKYYDGQSNRRTMLSEKFTHFAVGHVYFNGADFWVELFNGAQYSEVETPANDNPTLVTVEIAKNLFHNPVITLATDAYTVKEGKEVTLAQPLLTIELYDGWPENIVEGYGEFEYTTQNTDIISINGDKITGLKKGIATVTASCAGASKNITVFVEENSDKIIYGDVDGNKKVDSADALLALQYSIDKVTLSASQIKAADVNLDKVVNSVDSLYILQFSIDKIKNLPIQI